MKKTLLAVLLVTSTLLISGCGCGFNSGCCPDTSTAGCCGSSGW